jgi:hypothetical protein
MSLHKSFRNSRLSKELLRMSLSLNSSSQKCKGRLSCYDLLPEDGMRYSCFLMIATTHKQKQAQLGENSCTTWQPRSFTTCVRISQSHPEICTKNSKPPQAENICKLCLVQYVGKYNFADSIKNLCTLIVWLLLAHRKKPP